MVQVDEFGLTAGEFPSHWAQDGRHAHHPTISDTLLLMTAQADPLEQIVGDDLSFEATLQPEPNSICRHALGQRVGRADEPALVVGSLKLPLLSTVYKLSSWSFDMERVVQHVLHDC